MTVLLSACQACWSLRRDPWPEGQAAPPGTWFGVCGQCGALRTFEVIGTVNYTGHTTPKQPVQE